VTFTVNSAASSVITQTYNYQFQKVFTNDPAIAIGTSPLT
jgi:hypothetical protein